LSASESVSSFMKWGKIPKGTKCCQGSEGSRRLALSKVP
jgi:hypothetical protein